RMAVAAQAWTAIATVHIVLRRPINIVGDNQIETAIVVIVEPGSTRCPAVLVLNSSSRGHVGEGAIAVVVVENRTPVTANKEIGKSVVVIVSHRYTHAEEALGRDSSFKSYIGKSAIAVVTLKAGEIGRAHV